MIDLSKPSPESIGPRPNVKPVFSVVVMLAVVMLAVIHASAVLASQPGVRRLQSDVTKVVSVTGVVHPSPGGLVLKSAKGRYSLEGKDLSRYVGQKVIVSGTVKKSPAEKGPVRILSVSRVEPVEEKKD